jgi:hypothetical protein
MKPGQQRKEQAEGFFSIIDYIEERAKAQTSDIVMPQCRDNAMPR